MHTTRFTFESKCGVMAAIGHCSSGMGIAPQQKQTPRLAGSASLIGHNRNYCPEHWLHFFHFLASDEMLARSRVVRPQSDPGPSSTTIIVVVPDLLLR